MVFIKRMNNADAGDATHLGGDNWDNLDKYFDDTDIEATLGKPAKINTKTEVRSGKLVIKNPANTAGYTIRGGAISSNVNLDLPTSASDITLVAAGGSNDWGAAMQTFRSSNIAFRNPANTASYIHVMAAITANRNINWPLLTADDTVTFNEFATTLKNKTFNIDENTIKHSTTNTQGDILIYDTTAGKFKRLARGTANQVLHVNSAGTDLEWAAESGSVSADKIKVYEGGTQIGTIARKLNFDAATFNVTEDSINDRFDVVSIGGGGGGSGNTSTIFKNTTTVSVANTSTETNLLNQSINAGVMGTNGILHVVISGWYLNDGGGPETFTMRLKFGGVTLWEDTSITFSDHTMRRPIHMEFWVKNNNSASAQRTTGTYIIGNPADSPVGFSDFGAVATNPIGVINGANTTVATGTAQPLVITITHSDIDPNLSFNAEVLLVELIAS